MYKALEQRCVGVRPVEFVPFNLCATGPSYWLQNLVSSNAVKIMAWTHCYDAFVECTPSQPNPNIHLEIQTAC